MRRKILTGALALVLPAGIVVGTQTAAFAGFVSNPVSCTGLTGTVTFAGPLTIEGVATATKVAGNTGVSVTSAGTCSGGTAPNTGGPASVPGGSLTITGGKNQKLLKTDPRYNKATGVKYVTQTWGEFAASAGGLKKELKVVNFTINGAPEQFKTKGATATVCSNGDPGFILNGQVKASPFGNKTATITACLGSDTRQDASTGNFGADVGTDNGNGVVSAQIDAAVSSSSL